MLPSQALKTAALCVLSCALTLLSLEAAMIALEPRLSTGFFQYDPDIGFRVRSIPGTSNRFGFCDVDYPLTSHEGTTRVMVLGDSFGWSGGRYGNYTALMERAFAEELGAGRVDVVNAGYPMTNTGEQLKVLEKFGLRYRPDLLVLAFFVGNDFQDANPGRKRIVVNDTAFDIDARRERRVFGFPLVGRSRLLHFARQRLRTLAGLAQAGDGGQGALMGEEQWLALEAGRYEFCSLPRHARGEYDAVVGEALENVSRMSRVARREGIRFMVAALPDEFQVAPGLAARLRARTGRPASEYDDDLPQKLLAEHLKVLKVPFLDMTPAFRSEGTSKGLYLPRNTHWNEEGNRLAARILKDYISRMGWTPRAGGAAVRPAQVGG